MTRILNRGLFALLSRAVVWLGALSLPLALTGCSDVDELLGQDDNEDDDPGNGGGTGGNGGGGGGGGGGTGGTGGGGGTGPGNGNMGINGDDGGPYAAPLANGRVAGELELELPDETEFVLRGTLPVPPDVFPRGDGAQHFRILDFNGAALDTQNEVVTRYADDGDGAEVVEVIARVRRDPTKSSGSRDTYEVIVDPHGSVTDPGSTGLEDLTNATADLPQSVLDLFGDPTGIRISTTDVFGNEYACYPFDGTGELQVERHGASHSQLRIYQTLLPEPFVPGAFGTLTHFFGVHVYVSTLEGEDTVLFDVRFHNGHSGQDQSTDLDNPLGKVYFERIEIGVPNGWLLQQGFDDPFFGASYLDGTRTVFPVVDAIAGGKMHVMRWQGQFHRRLALSPTASADRARMYLDGFGQGFCRRGTADTGGHDYWSWWNEGTDRYWTQNHQLPSLEHIGSTSIRNTHASTLAWMEGHLANGTGDGLYPIQSAVQGWSHPYGVPYGGATSGAEIYMYDGVEVAEAASRLGWRVFLGNHRMATDRQPNALYDLDGEQARVEDWLISSTSGLYTPFDFYGVPILRPGDAFGVDQADTKHVDQVNATSRQPDYEDEHLRYDPIDLQHLIRYTRSAKVLVWLGNDPLAKDDLRMQAETGHLSYHEFNNNSGGGKQMTGLRYNIDDIQTNPGAGFTFGRGEAWLIDAMTATYACTDLDWRAAKRSWFDTVTLTLATGQNDCSGFVQSMVRPKFLLGKYRARQMIEQSIMENAFQGVRETIYRDADPAFFAMMGDVLMDSLYAFVSDMAWYPGEPLPWTHTATGPLDFSLPAYCGLNQIPSDGHEPQYEGYQIWASFAFGYEMSGDQKFLDRALTASGAQNLLNGLQGAGLSNIFNQAPTLALVQRRNGIL